LSVDFNFDKSWELYDLGMASKRSYSIVTSGYNNFYYAKINGFKDGIV
jgi:hypothetical protein